MALARTTCRQCSRTFRPSAPKFVRCLPCRRVNGVKRAPAPVAWPTVPTVAHVMASEDRTGTPLMAHVELAIRLADRAAKHGEAKDQAMLSAHIRHLVAYAEAASNGVIPSREWQHARLGFVLNRGSTA